VSTELVVQLLGHLRAETEPLVAVLADLDDDQWGTPTPSPRWTIADQVSHLSYFDDAASAAATGGFAPYLDEALRSGASMPDEVAARYRSLTPSALRQWFTSARVAMLDVLGHADPAIRLAWYGPDLSVASMASGRIMETWAHGQDVYDALGVPHPVTDALYDVARLCARTRQNSYLAHGRTPPSADVAVVLDAPDGSHWRFGDGDDAIRGSAVEFCLVATQRRHVDDTSLEARGDAAREWLTIAQAFAGPPGEGRAGGAAT
jgi:uncharacterized protein (TIGR03084 family)